MSEEKELDKLKDYTAKLEEIIKKASIPGHKTAPETHERLIKIENCLFGNKELDEKGLHEMVKFLYEKRQEQEKDHIMVTEMYDFFKGANFSRKILLWIFLALGTISGGIIGTIEVLKRLK